MQATLEPLAPLPVRPPPRNPWPLAITAYFVVFVAAMAAFIAFASRHRAELVRPDYYEEEIRHQRQMDRVARAADRPASITLGGGALDVTLPRPQAGRFESGRVELYRPSDASLDRSVPLDPGGDGAWRIDARDLRPGLWKVRVHWTSDGLEYFSERSVVVETPSR